ncbi:MAG: hypothetical protein IJQ66_03680, partial [Clostridia bacterium]|nr:hypothetical protein [Clostridia bacterium]
AKENAEKYFAEIGYVPANCYTQEYKEGAGYIYKFYNASEKFDKDALKTKIETALNDKELGELNLVVTVNYKETVVSKEMGAGVSAWKIILACAIAMVIAFVVVAVMNKLASAITVIVNSLIAIVLNIAIMAIVRVPAYPTLIIGEAVAAIFAMLFTFLITFRYKEDLKVNDKADVAEDGVKKSFNLISLVAIFGVICAIFIILAINSYFIFAGIQCAIAICVAYLVSLVATPVLWRVFRNIIGRK